jgi:hypothetical protein
VERRPKVTWCGAWKFLGVASNANLEDLSSLEYRAAIEKMEEKVVGEALDPHRDGELVVQAVTHPNV